MLSLLLGLAALVLPAAATAGTPLYGLTTDNRVVRLDLDRPGSVGRIVPLQGLRSDEHAVGIFTGPYGEFSVITSASRRLVLDPWSGELSVFLDGGSFSPGLPAGPVAASEGGGFDLGAVILAGDRGWRASFIPPRAETVDLNWDWRGSETGRPDVVAVSARTSDPNYLFAVDATQNALYEMQNFSGTLTRVGDLGVDVTAPAGLERLEPDSSAVLVSAVPDRRSAVHRVDTTTGAATLLGLTPPGIQLRDVTRVDPPTLETRTPTHIWTWSWNEGGPPATMTIVRMGDPEATATATIALGGSEQGSNFGPATSGADYDPAPIPVSLAPGQRTAQATFRLVDDDVAEGAETVTFAMSPGPGTRIGIGMLRYVTINDDDAMLPAAMTVAESVGTVKIPVTRPSTGSSVNVPGVAIGGTATAGADFALTGGTAGFAPGATTAPFVVTIRQDKMAEDDEHVIIGLGASPRDRVTGVSRHVKLTIRDDEPARSALSARRRHRIGKLLPVTVTCAPACRGSVELRLDARRAKRARLGRRVVRRTIAFNTAGKKTLRLRISRRAARALRRAAPENATLRLSVRPANRAGKARVVTRSLTLVR